MCAVGAASLRATLNCDAFATAHSAESHFDRSSFVGLAVSQTLSFFARPFHRCVLESRELAVEAAAGAHLLRYAFEMRLKCV